MGPTLFGVIAAEIIGRWSSEDESSAESRSEPLNPITQLIANQREKLMRLAALEGGATVNASTNTASHTDSVSESEKEDVRMVKCKSKGRSKGAKIKRGRISRKKCRVRRKLQIKKNESDSQSDAQPLDAEQPSTSSGLVSRRSRYAARSIDNYKHSSSSSEDEPVAEKRRKHKIDSDRSGKVQRLKKWRRNNANHESVESKNKQLTTVNDTQKNVVGKVQKDIVNTNSNTNSHRMRIEQSLTPHKKKSRIPPTPDSGISGVSTVEKSLEEVQRSWIGGGDSSDHEQKKRNLERFRKKVDVARQSYRNRCNPYSELPPNTSDSSD